MPRKKIDEADRRRCEQACDSCKRRKERCNGVVPCRRCIERNAAALCGVRDGSLLKRKRDDARSLSFVDRAEKLEKIEDEDDELLEDDEPTSQHSQREAKTHQSLARSNSTAVAPMSRLVQDGKGKHMFIGDSANLSFLQNIRKLVHSAIGSCSFVDDPLRHLIVEAVPEGSPSWLNANTYTSPPALSIDEATYLVQRYLMAMSCIVDLFDESELFSNLEPWLEDPRRYDDTLSPIYYLIFALGAQTCPQDKDDIANIFFDYGRYLTASAFMEDPSISTVQCYTMITMFLLGSSRRNAAFMYLGIAVRASYALGLHSMDISALFSIAECRTRERLWKAVRILDLFMSAALGRPPSTAETRDTGSKENYSAAADIADIFGVILTDVYSNRRVSSHVLEKVSERHRSWAERFHEGLEVDCIKPVDVLEGGVPNIGLLHLKEAYYWSIILLTRPFLIESISTHIAGTTPSSTNDSSVPKLSRSNNVLVHACVDSAIRTIDLLKLLLDYDNIPKLLPFVINSIFVSALVLGLAFFGDLYKIFPLKTHLQIARKLLAHFPLCAIARRTETIVVFLQEACDSYCEMQSQKHMDRYGQVVGGLFGQIHKNYQNDSSKIREHAKPNMAEDIQRPQEGPNGTDEHGWPSLRGGVQPDVCSQPLQSNDNVSSYSGQTTSPDYASMNDPTSTISSEEFDFSIPLMSPHTLRFESFHENNPLFSTIPNFNMDY